MLEIKNTLTKKKEPFSPIKDKTVGFYQCGPTVYWTQHIGNMRAMVLADLIRRSLEYLGYKVKLVRNYTDVGHLTSNEDEGEDKMIKAARRENQSPAQIAKKYIDIFEADVAALNCEVPWKKPRATEYIKEMARMVQTLIDKGFAYATNLAIYFDVSKVKNYTQLSGQDLDKNISEAGRGEVGDPGKRQPADFAIWFFKAGAHQNALQTWKVKFKNINQPVTEGFPGWHLECSAMSKSLLGDTIDIHMGGVEHIPVHHTNEIAQSEAANGVKFVNYWLHNEHLTVDGKKMSKSEGTSYTLADIIQKGYDPLALRYFFLSAHYRSKQNFTWEALEAAKNGLDNLYNSVRNIPEIGSGKTIKNKIIWSHVDNGGWILNEYREKFKKTLEDDFNIPAALAVLWEIIKSDMPDDNKRNLVFDFDKVLGLGLGFIEGYPRNVIKLANKRLKARQEKNWAESDRMRDEIARLGYDIEDGKDDYKLKKK